MVPVSIQAFDKLTQQHFLGLIWNLINDNREIESVFTLNQLTLNYVFTGKVYDSIHYS